MRILCANTQNIRSDAPQTRRNTRSDAVGRSRSGYLRAETRRNQTHRRFFSALQQDCCEKDTSNKIRIKIHVLAIVPEHSAVCSAALQQPSEKKLTGPQGPDALGHEQAPKKTGAI
jgi:hypothetical protein